MNNLEDVLRKEYILLLYIDRFYNNEEDFIIGFR